MFGDELSETNELRGQVCKFGINKFLTMSPMLVKQGTLNAKLDDILGSLLSDMRWRIVVRDYATSFPSESLGEIDAEILPCMKVLALIVECCLGCI